MGFDPPPESCYPSALEDCMVMKNIRSVHEKVVRCVQCPRLVRYCREVAKTKRRAYREEIYWGRPVPGWGDPKGRLLMIGLAPAAHGGNRTGRLFTGDASGDFLFRALHKAGFANQPISERQGDGLKLHDAYLTAVVHCAPPDNRPLPEEIENCRGYLQQELTLLRRVKAVLVFGRIALEGYRAALREASGTGLSSATVPFTHGASYDMGPSLPRLFISYHPSRQNTQTGRLTQPMLDAVFEKISAYLKNL
ncbi:MAG TPA: uracil-DNA glycosylase [Candidatus Manganitrophaceae bacterium]|nr:uracil-DNA glycosylase [Candidatus Manganitrophaceae bacterium]